MSTIHLNTGSTSSVIDALDSLPSASRVVVETSPHENSPIHGFRLMTASYIISQARKRGIEVTVEGASADCARLNAFA